MDRTDNPKNTSTKPFLLVGIGASAGGVSALQELFASIPAKTGMAYAVVLHLSQQHESNLDSILRTKTSMPVLQVQEPITVEPDHVYVIPPGQFLELEDGVIRLREPDGIELDGAQRYINLTVHHIAAPESVRGFLLILFEEHAYPLEQPTETDQKRQRIAGENAMEEIVRRLEDELQRTKDRLRNTVEQYETSLEELKASNEKLQAINEELRSASEELETSKEELQSVNEELTTVNYELKDTLEEVSRANADLQNLMFSTNIATIFLDRNLQIKRFTPEAQKLFNVIISDIGRPISHLTHTLEYNSLREDARQVLITLQTIEQELHSTEGKWYLARTLPYRTIEDRIDGIVLTFVDITERKNAEDLLKKSKERLRLLIESVTDYAIFTMDLDGKIDAWNPGAQQMFGYTSKEAIGQSGAIIFTPEDRKEGAFEQETQTALKIGRAAHERWHLRKDGSRFYVSGVMTLIQDGEIKGFVKIARDLTKSKQAVQALRASEIQISNILESITDAFFALDKNWKFTYVNRQAEIVLDRTPGDLLGKVIWDEYAIAGTEFEQAYRRTASEQIPITFTAFYTDHQRWYEVHTYPATDGISVYFQNVTEQKQAEDALRESTLELERQSRIFNTTLSSITDFAYIFDKEGRFIYANQPLLDLLAITLEEITGKNFFELPYPVDLATRLQEQIQQVFDTKTIVLDETPFTSPSGEQGYYEYIFSPVIGADGKVEVVAGSTRETTARKQMEETLREREDRLRLASQAVQAVIYDWNIKTDHVERCIELLHLLGFDPSDAEVTTNSWYRTRVHPEEDARTTKVVMDAIAARAATFQDEHRIRHRDGHYLWVLDSGVFLYDAAGNATRCVGSITDITSRKEAEESLRQSEERYRTLFNSIDEGFAICEMLFNEENLPYDYRFLEVNPMYKKLTGLNEAIGKTGRELEPNLEEKWFKIYGDVVRTGESIRFESHLAAWDKWYDLYVTRIGDPKERKFAILFNDITERKMSEQALRDADRRKNDFLATLAHELRNPLTPIRSALEILNHTDKREQEQQARMIIERQIRKIVILVDDLLEISRITRGKIKIHKELISVQSVIRDVIETIEPLMTAAKHQFTIQMPDDLVCINADEVRIAQIIINIVNNAIKYTNNGGAISLILTTESDQAVIRVKDNGIGIPTDRLERIFQLFEQVEQHGRKFQSGLGIGLSLARELTELHGGTITAYSEGEGKGSEFTLRLPLAEDQTPLDGELPCEDEPTIPAFEGDRKKILVVEDDIDIADMLKAVLEMENYTVKIANTGEYAIQLASEFLPEAALVDIGLPDIGGHEVARRLRRQHSDLLLLAHSGWGSDEDLQRSKEAGFDYHLVKPAEIEEIINILKKGILNNEI